MAITSLSQAITAQAEINRFLASQGIKDLVGDYGELLVHEALGGHRKNAVNQGFDIKHNEFKRIEVKTRKYELLQDGKVRKENRAVGFKGKEAGFDWLAHVVLDTNFEVVAGRLAAYHEVWPEVKTKDKIGFATTSSLPSSIDITNDLKDAQKRLGFNV